MRVFGDSGNGNSPGAIVFNNQCPIGPWAARVKGKLAGCQAF
jgi:hypothetical protein